MVDKPQPAETKVDSEQPAVIVPAQPPRRAPGHRSTDARDTVAEMALRAQEISQEAGSKIAQAIKDVINAAAGLTGFAVESARDIVQYMVRRGQMTQEEADRIMREAEEANSTRKPMARPVVVAAAPAPGPPTMAPPKSAPTPPPTPSAPPPSKVAAVKVAPPPAKAAAPTKASPAAAKHAKHAPPKKAPPKAAAKKRPAAKGGGKAASRPSGKKKR
ncbi:MAG TPA: hypothetical protein VIC55_07200 [Gemmatimonadaceae bacterium]|jgi:hypothetical protein